MWVLLEFSKNYMSVFNVLNEALVGVEWGFSQVLVFVQVRFQLVNILCMCVCVYQVCVCVCVCVWAGV